MTARGKAAQAVRAMPSATAPLQNLRTILSLSLTLSSRVLDGCSSTRLPLLLFPARVLEFPFSHQELFFPPEKPLCSSSRARTKRVMCRHPARESPTRSLVRLAPVHHQGSSNLTPRGGDGSRKVPRPEREDSASAVLYTCISIRVRG